MNTKTTNPDKIAKAQASERKDVRELTEREMQQVSGGGLVWLPVGGGSNGFLGRIPNLPGTLPQTGN